MPRSSLPLRSHSGPSPPPNRTRPPPEGEPTERPPGTQEEGTPGRRGGAGVGNTLLLPVASVLLKLLPVHFRVTTRPEAHPSLKWKKSEFMISTQGL